MKRLLLPLALLASVALVVAQNAPEVLACSVGPDFDLVKDSDLIVSGRFTGWELDTESGGFAEVIDPEQSGGQVVAYGGIRAKMLVDRVFKGTASPEITVTSANTVDVYDHEPKYVWIGSSGACGAFDSDPTGRYAIMGLWAGDDGKYGAFTGSWFYSGDNPPPDFEDRGGRRLTRLEPLLPGYLPGASGPPVSAGQFPIAAAAVAATLGPLAFLFGAAFLWRRGERHSG